MLSLGLGLTPAQCQQAFQAGDMAYFSASGCAEAKENDHLIATKKSELSTKTMMIIGGGVLLTGIILYVTLKSK
jgi:hypothetical protein